MFSTITSTSAHWGGVTAVTCRSPRHGAKKANGGGMQVSVEVAHGLIVTCELACGQSPFGSAP